jgi:uncharacterized protein YcbK (DUF882 family)
MTPFVFTSATTMPSGFWKWPHIDPAKEWADRMSGRLVVVPEFLDKLEALRAAWGRPLIINSAYRTPEHNIAVATTGEAGPHTTGRAVDLACAGAEALELVRHALALGFTGVGVQQKDAARYVHLDDLTPSDGFVTRPWLWSY